MKLRTFSPCASYQVLQRRSLSFVRTHSQRNPNSPLKFKINVGLLTRYWHSVHNLNACVFGPTHLIKTTLIENGIKGLNTDLSQAFRLVQYWSNIIPTLHASQIEIYIVSQDLLPPPPQTKTA